MYASTNFSSAFLAKFFNSQFKKVAG